MQDIVFKEALTDKLKARAMHLGISNVLVICEKSTPSTDEFFRYISSQPNKGSCVRASPLTIRKLVEHTKPAIIHGIESQMPKDYIHQRGSGLNHIICKLMAMNNISYAFDFSQLLQFARDRPAILGRMRQNVVLCQKYGIPMRIASFAKHQDDLRSIADLKSLFHLLGMQPHELRNAFEARNQ